MTKPKSRRLQFLEEKQIHDRVLANSTPINGNESTRFWNTDYNPERIAKEVGPDISANHVRVFLLRINIIMKYRNTKRNESTQNLESRIEYLEEQNLELIGRIEALENAK